MPPLGYLITISCYGQRLHGDPRGSVDRDHSVIGGPYLPESSRKVAMARWRMTQPPYTLDAERRKVVLDSVIDACRHRGWSLHAVHVRPRHVHAVISSDESADDVIERIKTNASWFLRKGFSEPAGTRRWSDGASRRRLRDQDALREACTYVVHKQGRPMEVYEHRGR